MPLTAESTISLISMFLNLFISLVLVWQNQRFLAVRFRDAALNLQADEERLPAYAHGRPSPQLIDTAPTLLDSDKAKPEDACSGKTTSVEAKQE